MIDDEPMGLRLLKTYCEQLEHYCEVVDTFFSPDKFLEKHESMDYDLLMLDIDMDGMKGTDLARILSDKQVIFVTGRDGFDKEVLDLQFSQDNIVTLIRKPLDKEKVEKALKKFLSGKSKRTSVVLHTNNGDRNISFEDMLLITTKDDGFKKGILERSKITGKFDSRNKILVTKSEVLLLPHIDIKELKTSLPSDLFIQISRSTIVSRKSIFACDSEGISFIPELKSLISTAQFNVTKDYEPDFKKWYRK